MPGTGAITKMKQSFSDLNQALEDTAKQHGADDQMDVASDGMQASLYLHSVHNNPQVIAGGGSLMSGVKQGGHIRTKSDATFI